MQSFKVTSAAIYQDSHNSEFVHVRFTIQYFDGAAHVSIVGNGYSIDETSEPVTPLFDSRTGKLTAFCIK